MANLSMLVLSVFILSYVEVVEGSEQLLLFLQNKPNFRKAQINISAVLVKNYEEIQPPNPAKANPKQTQSNPI